MGYSHFLVEMKNNSLNLLLLCIICYLLLFYRGPFKNEVEGVQQPLEGKPDARYLFVNTSQCQMIAMDALSPMAQHYMTPMPIYWCYMIKLMEAKTIGGRNYLQLVAGAKELWEKLGVRRLSEISCAYNRFERSNDYLNKYLESKVFRFSRWSNFTEVKSGNITLRVWCWMDFGRLVYHDVLLFLPLSEDQIRKAPSPEEPVKRLSVLILGIDSISHMHYLRYFRFVLFLRSLYISVLFKFKIS